MPTILHMDVAALLAIAKELREMQGKLGRYTHVLGNHVYGLSPDWQGNAAVQFFDEYGQWQGAISGMASDCGDIADKLAEAAANWTDADSTF